MKPTKRLLTSLVVAGGIALAAAPLTQAETGSPGMHMRGMAMGDSCPMSGMGRGGKHGHGAGMMNDRGMMGGHGMMPRFLHGIDLTEEQQDKVFAILYPLMPGEREHHKAVRELKQQQKALTESANFDAGKLKKLLDAEAKAHAEHKLELAKAHNKIFQLLTDEQKTTLAQRQQARQ